METPEPTSGRFKLGRWLLLLSVITAALGFVVFWKSQDEQLRFVRTVGSTSLTGMEAADPKTTEPNPVGELWEFSRSAGLIVFGRGHSRRITGQYPVFPSGNRFLQSVSELLLDEQRQGFLEMRQGFRQATDNFQLSQWWEDASFSEPTESSTFDELCEVLFVGESAMSIKTSATGTGVLAGDYKAPSSDYATCFRNFVDRDDQIQELKLEDFFRPGDWLRVLSDLCSADLRRQKVDWMKVRDASDPRPFVRSDLSDFSLMPDGIVIHFRRNESGPTGRDPDYTVLIPFVQLTDHLRPEGPHRQVQQATKK